MIGTARHESKQEETRETTGLMTALQQKDEGIPAGRCKMLTESHAGAARRERRGTLVKLLSAHCGISWSWELMLVLVLGAGVGDLEAGARSSSRGRHCKRRSRGWGTINRTNGEWSARGPVPDAKPVEGRGVSLAHTGSTRDQRWIKLGEMT